jgi:hypothetical protein
MKWASKASVNLRLAQEGLVHRYGTNTYLQPHCLMCLPGLSKKSSDVYYKMNDLFAAETYNQRGPLLTPSALTSMDYHLGIVQG